MPMSLSQLSMITMEKRMGCGFNGLVTKRAKTRTMDTSMIQIKHSRKAVDTCPPSKYFEFWWNFLVPNPLPQ